MNIEETPGLVAFPNTVDRIKSDRKRCHLVSLWEELYRTHGELYLIQKQHGFYQIKGGPDRVLLAAEKNPILLSPQTVVKEGPGGKLQAFLYPELDEYRETSFKVAQIATQIADEAKRRRFKEWKQLGKVLAIQAEPYLDGDFETAKDALAALPVGVPLVDDPVFTLQDIYADPLSRKYSFLGWLDRINSGLTDYHNKIAQKAIERIHDRSLPDVNFRVRSGDVAWFSGLAAEMRWSGQSRRRGLNAQVNIFTNSFDDKFESRLKGFIEKYVPEVTQKRGWERMAKSAAMILLVLHEVGHTQANIELGTLGKYTAYMNELRAEVNGQWAATELPVSMISPDKLRMIFACSFAWAMSDIAAYDAETDPKKKETIQSYAESGISMIDYYIRKGCIAFNEDNQTIKIGDISNLNRLRVFSRQHALFLKEATERERERTGFVAENVNPHGDNQSPHLHIA